MYTNELLEQKYKAQKELEQKAVLKGMEYHELIKEEVRQLFNSKNWKLKYSKRKGGHGIVSGS